MITRSVVGGGDPLPFWAYGPFSGNHGFAVGDDPSEARDLAGTDVEAHLRARLRDALQEVDAPGDQLVRLGLD